MQQLSVTFYKTQERELQQEPSSESQNKSIMFWIFSQLLRSDAQVNMAKPLQNSAERCHKKDTNLQGSPHSVTCTDIGRLQQTDA